MQSIQHLLNLTRSESHYFRRVLDELRTHKQKNRETLLTDVGDVVPGKYDSADIYNDLHRVLDNERDRWREDDVPYRTQDLFISLISDYAESESNGGIIRYVTQKKNLKALKQDIKVERETLT